MIEKPSLDPIYIGLFGSTGAGKSSLINAIIRQAMFLPVSGESICTSCIVQVSSGCCEQYEAKIHLLSDQVRAASLLPSFLLLSLLSSLSFSFLPPSSSPSFLHFLFFSLLPSHSSYFPLSPSFLLPSCSVFPLPFLSFLLSLLQIRIIFLVNIAHIFVKRKEHKPYTMRKSKRTRWGL